MCSHFTNSHARILERREDAGIIFKARKRIEVRKRFLKRRMVAARNVSTFCPSVGENPRIILIQRTVGGSVFKGSKCH